MRLTSEGSRDKEETETLCAEMATLGLIGRTPGMLALYSWIRRVSPASDLPVLITGETGTGKELVARAIHRCDPRRQHGPFVSVNCIALSSGVADSELFGHRRGAFTGATEDHRGCFRTADRGVLFLDEIGDLEMPLQGKLLRVLQEGRVRAVGEDREVTVNARVIGATNKDLRALIGEGRFRLDLFHRLAVLETRIPPLSERRGDMGLLVAHLVEKHAYLRPTFERVNPSFTEALARLDLPGNVRELENLVRRALAERPEGTDLTIDDLPPEIRQSVATPAPSTMENEPSDVAPARPRTEKLLLRTQEDWTAILASADMKLFKALAVCERGLLLAALDSAGGNQSLAARLLGITPRSVYNKIRRHGLNR